VRGIVSVCEVYSLSLFRIDALPVEVEVDVGAGLPGFSIVGLPDAAVSGARERVRWQSPTAVTSSPPKRS
jgi:magnesium chelatase family protein